MSLAAYKLFLDLRSNNEKIQADDKEPSLFILGDLGKAVGELVTVMTEDTSKTNGQRAPPPAFK